ncbi:MAG: mannose-1-phosphate guanylyltransferase/mannose-6-phosphate isomerase [Gammaproteobacteria bacterium RIFCSPHIGHO2_12_FULL_37_14]|nr:MAG: mannose-1-phosphate guanylyltransferase/mannose-6-phosphate isomerase [Gammaproteobacteria bacterium RIFCSPHIGHO2_12_FULL_37_14]
MIVPIILAGGTGSRLWPLSRSAYPKQLLPLVSNKTLLQETILRTQSIPDVSPPIVICNQEHRFFVAEQLQSINIKNAKIILEPIGKNTAPATAIAALYLKEQDPILLILPADHLIEDSQHYAKLVESAIAYAQDGWLITFGVIPTIPETGYGYIKASQSLKNDRAYIVEKFIEKPDIEMAKLYLNSGQYYWNSGMFMFKASQYLSELKRYAPTILKTCQRTMSSITKDLDFIRLDKTLFAATPSNSIDYAVMEKTNKAILIPLDTFWSDIGSWKALCDVQKIDQNGNTLQGDIIIEDVKNSYLRAESRMVAAVGVSDHIIVETSDAVLVVSKDKSQSIKNIVSRLKQNKRSEIDLHRKVCRPWGFYEILYQGKCFQVKRIVIKPNCCLSLQMHYHRSEHWIVVNGIAQVTRGEDVFMVFENESTYIPMTIKHRLANLTENNIEIIEVQLGSYLGEDDIVRFEDSYGRTLNEQ